MLQSLIVSADFLNGRQQLAAHAVRDSVRDVFVQVALGITTLLTYVPVSLGSAHQAGALTLFSVALALMHTLRRPLAAGAKAGVAGRMFTPVAALATVGVWAAVLQAPKETPLLT